MVCNLITPSGPTSHFTTPAGSVSKFFYLPERESTVHTARFEATLWNTSQTLNLTDLLVIAPLIPFTLLSFSKVDIHIQVNNTNCEVTCVYLTVNKNDDVNT